MSRKTTSASRRRGAAEWRSGRPRASAPGRAGVPGRTAGPGPAGSVASAAATVSAPGRIAAVLTDWAPTAGRILLGAVLLWFGYHELAQPDLWTGYVPVVGSGSDIGVILVLAHGLVLLVLAMALVAGIAPRTAAAVTALLLAEIVTWLTVTGGVSDLVIRDAGVLGLAVCLTGCARQRAVLSR